MFTDSHPGKMHQTTYGQHFSSTSIGPVIAYNFVEHHQDRCVAELRNVRIGPTDKVMIIVGEVDCRWHLPKRIATNNESVESVVEDCANRFFRSILNLRSLGFNPVTWCGHPSTTSGHSDNPSEPVWGDCLFRNRISIEWKTRLQKLSTDNNIPCVSIIDELIGGDGMTNMSYFRDYCHLDTSKVFPVVLEKTKFLL